jgi:hypothetical protein
MKVANCPNVINFWGAQYASGRRFTYKCVSFRPTQSNSNPTQGPRRPVFCHKTTDRPTDRRPCRVALDQIDAAGGTDRRHDRTPAGGRLLSFIVVVVAIVVVRLGRRAGTPRGRSVAPAHQQTGCRRRAGDGPPSRGLSGRYPERQQQGRPLRRLLRLVVPSSPRGGIQDAAAAAAAASSRALFGSARCDEGAHGFDLTPGRDRAYPPRPPCRRRGSCSW